MDSCPRLFALFILYIVLQEKDAAVRDRQRDVRDAGAIVLPQQFAGADVVRKHLFAEHDFVRHGSGRVVGHPARERVDGMPMQAAALEMGVGPCIGARVNSLHGFQGGERILRRVGLAHPLTVFHEGVPEITVLAGQRHGAGTEKNVAIHADVSPAQSLAPGLSWDCKLAQCAPCLSV